MGSTKPDCCLSQVSAWLLFWVLLTLWAALETWRRNKLMLIIGNWGGNFQWKHLLLENVGSSTAAHMARADWLQWHIFLFFFEKNFYSTTEQKTAGPEGSFLQWLARELGDGKHGLSPCCKWSDFCVPAYLAGPLTLEEKNMISLSGEGFSIFVLLCLFVKNTALFHAVREKGKQSYWNLKWCQDIFSTQRLAINKTDILYLGHYS